MKTPVFAGFWTRHLAYFLDTLIIWTLWALLSLLFISVFWLESWASDLVMICASFSYFIWMHYKFGQTLWKMALWVKVIDKTWKALTLPQSIWRGFATILSSLPFMLWYFWAGWDKEKRTFHDMLAWTRVVEVRFVAAWIVFLWNFLIFLLSIWFLWLVAWWMYQMFMNPEMMNLIQGLNSTGGLENINNLDQLQNLLK